MVWAVLAAGSQFAVAATRADLAVRLQEFEAAWGREAGEERRRAAVGPFSRAVTGFLGGSPGSACRSLDEALAALQGRERAPEDALSLEVVPQVVEPGGAVEWTLRKSYASDVQGTGVLQYAGAEVPVGPGASVTGTLSGLVKDAEVVVRFGPRTLRRRVAVVHGIAGLAKSAEASSHPELSAFALAYGAAGRLEVELDWHALAARAQALLSGERSEPPEERYALEGSTLLRAWVPKAGSDVAVVALHGAGGNEHLFFEGYGQGLCRKLAQERGWVFASPRGGSQAVQASIRYLTSAMGRAPKRVFLMGHSAGGAGVFAALRAGVEADGLALFAPAASGWPEESKAVPAFLAVGAQEMAMLAGGASRLREGRPDAEFYRPDPCEHYLVVAESAAKAYAFFDRVLADKGW